MTNIIFSIIIFFLFFPDAKAQWTEQYSGDTVIFKSISAVNNNIAWISGDIQRVYKTINGGTNWIRTSSLGIPYPLSLTNIFALDEHTALITGTFVGERTYVFKTSNGGDSWSQVFNQNNGFINSIWMTDSLKGFMQGDPVSGRWSLWKTNNGGVSWDSTGLYLPDAGKENGYVNSMYVSSEGGSTSIWFGTGNYRVYFSSNGGSSWAAQITPSSQYIYSIWFNSLSNGMRGGSDIYHTTNSGQNWNLSSSMISQSGMTGEENKWWNVEEGFSDIYFSSNNGANWTTQFTSSATQFTHINISRNHTNQYSVWAVGNPGRIFKLMTSTEVTQISTEVPEKYYLSQNYPNPFNPSTTLVFKIPKNGFVKIKVYDILGKEIKTLVDDYKIAGTYELTINNSTFESGIYFYKMEVNNFFDIKKMIILK